MLGRGVQPAYIARNKTINVVYTKPPPPPAPTHLACYVVEGELVVSKPARVGVVLDGGCLEGLLVCLLVTCQLDLLLLLFLCCYLCYFCVNSCQV